MRCAHGAFRAGQGDKTRLRVPGRDSRVVSAGAVCRGSGRARRKMRVRLVGRKIVVILTRLTLKISSYGSSGQSIRRGRRRPRFSAAARRSGHVGRGMDADAVDSGSAAGEHHHAVRLGVRRRHESDESQLLQSVADLDRDRYRALCVLLLVDYGIVRSDPAADRRQARKTACFRGLVFLVFGRGRGYERA